MLFWSISECTNLITRLHPLLHPCFVFLLRGFALTSVLLLLHDSVLFPPCLCEDVHVRVDSRTLYTVISLDIHEDVMMEINLHGCMALVMLVVLNYSGVEFISIDVDMLVLAPLLNPLCIMDPRADYIPSC